MHRTDQRANFVLLLVMAPVIAWSAWRPYDWTTWWLETTPVFLGFIPLFIAGRKKWVFSNFALVCIGLHMTLLLVGGHYTYARTPLGEWAKEWFGFTRNHYDRLGHFVQGFVPAVLFREIMIRQRAIKRGWLNVLTVSFCLAISAVYELLEWAAALVSEEASESFLGTQGDNWDTQQDIFTCLIGALTAVLLTRWWQNRSMRKRAKK
jgi:putative membrane protein